MMNIAFLGLGNMGGPMAANLVAAGHTVHGFDPVPALKAAAEGNGVKVFDTGAAAVADADVVISSLPNGAVVKACYDEVLPAAKAGALFIDTSTISVADARDIHKQATEQGFAQLDAPVSGGVKGATAGTLAFMVGGEDEAVERARPVLEPLAGKIIHCGGSGNGQSAKLCNNMVLAVQQIAVGEAFVLAEKLGLSAQSLFDVITGATGNCWSVHTNCPVPGPVPTSPANNDFKPGFATALMNKDLGPGDGRGELDRLNRAAGHPRRRDLRQVQRRPRRQGLQRGHRTAARQLTLRSSAYCGVGRLVRGRPAAVQPLAIRDPHRLAARVVRPHRHGGGDFRRTVAGDDHGGQTRGGRRPQPRGRTRDGERVLRGYPELPQCGSESLGIRHGLLDIVGGHHRFDDTVADQLSHQRLHPASLATCNHAHHHAGGERLHDEIDQPGPRRQVGVEDHLVEHHRLGRVDIVGEQLGQHVGLGGDAALAQLGRDPLAFVGQRQQLAGTA